MFDAFPRRHPGMSVWEAVTPAFDERDGGFVPFTCNANVQQRHIGGVGWQTKIPDLPKTPKWHPSAAGGYSDAGRC
jgi:hypothetical protein